MSNRTMMQRTVIPVLLRRLPKPNPRSAYDAGLCHPAVARPA
jgi:hypothetical protein